MWLIETIGESIPPGTVGLERKKQCNDTEEAEHWGRAVNWKDRTKQRETLWNWLFIFITIKTELMTVWEFFFQAKHTFCTLCLLFSLNYVCFQLNLMPVFFFVTLSCWSHLHRIHHARVVPKPDAAFEVPGMRFSEQRRFQKKIGCLTPEFGSLWPYQLAAKHMVKCKHIHCY